VNGVNFTSTYQEGDYLKVLVVEDNPMNLKLIKLIIKNLNFLTYYAMNGREAIELLDSLLPDLILCDIQMPEVDGIQLLHYIRSSGKFDKTKIIALTAHAMVGDREKYIEMGFDEYVSKPIDTRSFRDLLLKYQSHFRE
jgi:CheY-like chemotaxis protein